MDDHEYVIRFNELYTLLERAYKDFYYLQTIGDIIKGAARRQETTISVHDRLRFSLIGLIDATATTAVRSKASLTSSCAITRSNWKSGTD